MELWDRLEAVSDRWNVLRHPFYVRWSDGELTPDELALYAGQYAHAVTALAKATRHAANAAPPEAEAELAGHAAEEEAHVDLWWHFGDAVGADRAAAPLAETAECAGAWADSERELLPTLVALHAIESAQPAISKTKRAGLLEHYGKTQGPATAYFDTHVTRDVEHARAGRRLVEWQLASAETDEDALIAEAERVLAANWRLLDGVERATAPPA